MNAFSQFVAFQMAQPALPPAKPRTRKIDEALITATLDHIKRHPNQDAREIACVLDVPSEQMHSILQKLKRQGDALPKSGHGPRNVWVAI